MVMATIGSVVGGRFRLLREIGRGAAGTVYAALDVAAGTELAVKILDVGEPNRAPDLARFELEARTARALSSRHVVNTVDAAIDDVVGPYLAMELLSGEDLETMVQRTGPLPPAVVARVASQAARGLAAAHGRNVIHRDIKPGNLFLARQQDGSVVVKLLDFGIATTRHGLTGARDGEPVGSCVGTPFYMSPEQIIGARSVDARADVWALGMVMYTALAGCSPFSALHTFAQIAIAVCAKPLLPVQRAAPWVTADVASVVHTAVRKDPSERYPSGVEMAAAIRACVAEDDLHVDMLVGIDDACRARRAAPVTLAPEDMLLSPAALEAILAGPASRCEALTTSIGVSADTITVRRRARDL